MEEMEEMLVEFQLFLKENKLITKQDWDLRKAARVFIKGRDVVNTNYCYPDIENSLPCEHEYRSGFNLKEGSFTWCPKCKQRF